MATDSENNCDSNVRVEDNIFAAVSLMKIALRKHAQTKYHSVVKNLPEFVESFNHDLLEYEQRVGYQRVFDTAEQLKKWSWR